MDSKAEGAVQKKTTPGIAQQLAAGLYYHEQGTKGKQFEYIGNAEEIKPWFERALAILQHIEKMDMMLIPKTEIKAKAESEAKNLEILTQIIDGFVKKLNTAKPELFPSAELAHRILDGKIS